LGRCCRFLFEKHWLRWVSSLLVVVICAGGDVAASAQGPVDAAVQGRVVLPDGEAASGARVLVQAADGGIAQVLRAGEDGKFFALRLTPGEYRVCAEAGSAVEALGGPHEAARAVSCGTEPLSGVAELELEAGEVGDVAVRLVVGPGVASGAGATGSLLQGRDCTRSRIEALPLAGREWEGVAALSSGANVAVDAGETVGNAGEDEESGSNGGGRGAEAADGTAASGLSYAGMAAVENRSLLDGLSAEQRYRSGPRGSAEGGPRMASTFGEGAVGEMRVMPRMTSAEYGGAAGGIVAVVSRSESAELHGSGFLQSRQSAWAAANPFSVVTGYRDGVVASGVVKPGDSNVQFGGAVGGMLGGKWVPVGMRKRVGVFGSVEVQRRASTVVSTPADSGFFELTPMQVALLGNRGVNAAATNAALDYLSGLGGVTEREAWRVLAFGRADAQVGTRDRLTLGYQFDRLQAPAGAAVGQASEAVVARGRGSLGESVVHIDAVSGRWLRAFSPRWNNEVRGQFAHDLEFETPDAPLAQEPGIGPGGLAPEVSIAPNGFAYGTTANLGRMAYPEEWRVELADTLEVVAGKNLFRMGGDWSRVGDRVASLTNAEGTFLYDSGTTNGRAGGLVDWITDYTFNVHAYPNGACPSITAKVHDFCFRSYSQSFGANGGETRFALHDFAGFVEDGLALGESLRVTVGVRYDYTLLPLPQQPNVVLDEALEQIDSPMAGTTGSFPEDRNNFGPRVSVVWAPTRGRAFVVRVGYGAFYGQVPGATVRAALADTALPRSTTHVRFTPTTEVDCPQVANQGFGYVCSFTSAPPQAVAQTTSATVFAKGFRDPAVQRATLEVQREFGRWLSLKVGYAMATATQLPSSADLNIAASTGYASYAIQGGDAYKGLHTGEMFAVPLYTERRTTLFGPVTAVVSNANSTYHSGMVEAWWRLKRQMQVRGSYTFSRAIDYGPQTGATPRLNGQFDPFADGYDKGLSSLQFPQRFSGDLVWSPEMEGGSRELRRALNGWRMAAIGVAGSGAVYSYGVFGGTRLSGGYESLNGSGGATYLPTVGRNTLRLAPRGRVDLRVARGVSVGQKWHVEGFAEAFNLLNSENVSRVQTRAFLVGTPVAGQPTPLVFQDTATIAAEGLTTLPFGAPTSSTTGLSRERQLEFGVRATF
jgi:hypothetical protein